MASQYHRRKAIHFFKIILQYSLQEGKLKVPNKFVRKYAGGLPNPVFLKPPDGTQWEIYWTKNETGEVWFEKGWNEVARYYSLDHGHLVVFKYEGTCHFGVNIFDKSATEIGYPLHANLEQDSDDSNSVEVLYKNPPLHKKGSQKRPLPSSFGPSMEGERTSNWKVMNAEQKFIKHELEEHIGGSNSKERSKSKGIIKGTEKPLTCAEKAKALKRISTFMSENPYFKIAIQPAYLRGTLSIPQSFVEQHLKKKKKNKGSAVLLRVSDGRTWYAKLSVNGEGSRHRRKLVSGWNSFARDNNLEVGDVCVFELTNSTGLSFLVHIFGESKNSTC